MPMEPQHQLVILLKPMQHKLALGSHSNNMVMSSTKSMTGHLLGAAGGIEAIFSTLSIKDQVAPPTINIFNQDPLCDLDYAANEAKEISHQ